MLRKLSIVTMLLIVPFLLGTNSYNYSYWGDAIHSAPGMTFAASINSEELGAEFASPEDLVVHNNEIYVIDSDTNSLIVINEDFSLRNEQSLFPYSLDYLTELGIADKESATLNSPLGLDVTDNGIFICDTGNYRIIKLNHDFEIVAIFDHIEDDTFLAPGEEATDDNQDKILFEPKKITVDATDRMYVVAKNAFEGILELNYDGSFNRYTGVNPVQLTPFEIFSRSIMTEEQIAQLQLFLPTEYTNVDINQKNFIFATSKATENNNENMIQLINPKGIDVLKRNGYHPPVGDVIFYVGNSSYAVSGPSDLVDIAHTDDGIYTVLDQKRSRLFTYDNEGNLLYIDGDAGSQVDKFNEGVALSYFGDDLLILDRGTKTIVVYQLTEFGALVNEAIHYHNNGMFDEAAEVWNDVIKINSNYEIAYNGIGKLLLRQGSFKEAMEYFELGHDHYYYSKAYQEYRNEILKENFGLIAGSILVVAIGLIYLRVRKIHKKGGSLLYED